ncbi:hypothetical protein TNCV_2904001 [Trichonephila clavipes]|nr:hypothetical protein TNCV_2904001 [Trichonephila clavipes]
MVCLVSGVIGYECDDCDPGEYCTGDFKISFVVWIPYRENQNVANMWTECAVLAEIAVQKAFSAVTIPTNVSRSPNICRSDKVILEIKHRLLRMDGFTDVTNTLFVWVLIAALMRTVLTVVVLLSQQCVAKISNAVANPMRLAMSLRSIV